MSWTLKKVFGNECVCEPPSCDGATTCSIFCPPQPPGTNGTGVGIATPCTQICGYSCVAPVLITLGNTNQNHCPHGQRISYNPATPEGYSYPPPITLPCLVGDPDQGNSPYQVGSNDFLVSNPGQGNVPGPDAVARFYSRVVGYCPRNSYSSVPNLSNGPSNNLHLGLLEFDFESYVVKDRVMVISGYNRYNYIGPLSIQCTASHRLGEYPLQGGGAYFDGNSDYYYCPIGLSGNADPNQSYSFYGGAWWSGGDGPNSTNLYGVKKIQRSWSGRYPLPDSVMDFPLFGATGETAPPGGGIPLEGECCEAIPPIVNTPCVVGCYSDCDANYALGHYFGPQSFNGQAEGRYSAACFNPDSHIRYNDETPDQAIHFPHCSLYTLLWSVRNWVLLNCINQNTVGDPLGSQNQIPNSIWQDWGPGRNTDTANGMSGSTGNPFWYDYDPGLGGYGGNVNKMNAISIMEALANNMPTTNGEFRGIKWKIPRVLFWDQPRYDAAPTWQKWQHVYIAGSLNVLMDTGCIGTQGKKERYFSVDSTCLKAGDFFENQAKVIGFMGCQPAGGSVYNIDIAWLPCSFSPGSVVDTWFRGFTDGCVTNYGSWGGVA